MTGTYYTGRGDDGTTGILSGKRIRKDDPLLDAIGNVDELNSAIGIAIVHNQDAKISGQLKSIQNVLFIIGAGLASPENPNKFAKFEDKHTHDLEQWIEEHAKLIPDLKQFVLPGGSEAAAHLQFARAMARRAERAVMKVAAMHEVDIRVVKYLNRLSSYLFLQAIYLNYKQGVRESHPTY